MASALDVVHPEGKGKGKEDTHCVHLLVTHGPYLTTLEIRHKKALHKLVLLYFANEIDLLYLESTFLYLGVSKYVTNMINMSDNYTVTSQQIVL